MILDKMFNGETVEIMKKVLEFSSRNHEVISNNIANVETPGFTAKRLVFEESLKDAVKSGDLQRLKEVTGEIENNYDNPYRMDMNNVDVEKEILSMEENRLRYEVMGNLLKKKYLKLNKIIEGVKY